MVDICSSPPSIYPRQKVVYKRVNSFNSLIVSIQQLLVSIQDSEAPKTLLDANIILQFLAT